MNRRRFITGVAATVTLGGLVSTRAGAEDLPRLSEDDATAKALGYVHDGSSVAASLRAADNICSGCQLFGR